VGKALVEHPEVPVISFTGSTETGSVIGETCGRMHKRLSLEMGGKNAMIVMDDADLDLALEGVLWGAFGTTGQRCTATSRLILHRKIHDRFLRRLAEAAEGLRLGDGRAGKTDVGPLIHEASREKVERYVEIGREQGAELVTGGKAPGGRLAGGWFFRPTVFAGVKPGSRLEQEEIFGPVLSVLTFRTPEEAVEKANNTPYGLSAGVWTDKGSRILWMAERLRAGVIWANTYNRFDPASPFGGYKESGFGREGGLHGLEPYLEFE
jgi:aldehyde dehydrogenase (NAD+)